MKTKTKSRRIWLIDPKEKWLNLNQSTSYRGWEDRDPPEKCVQTNEWDLVSNWKWGLNEKEIKNVPRFKTMVSFTKFKSS